MILKYREVWRLAWGIVIFATAAQVPIGQASPSGAQQASAHDTPRWLSETTLYRDISTFEVSAELTEFRPNYPLWTDGALKTRWVYFPPGGTIDTSDPDHWIFPVGTVFFKEFRKSVAKDLYSMHEIKVETRLLAKTGDDVGSDAWTMRTYAWNQEQTDAALSAGYENVLGTNHDIPTAKQCLQCHRGSADIVLGFDAIQLSAARVPGNINAIPARVPVWTLAKLDKAALLSHPFTEQPEIPGTKIAKQALGYLHGNCGLCHNPLGEAYQQDVKHMILRHRLAATTVEETDVYRTTVNQRTRNFTRVPYIIKGGREDELSIFQSAIFVRMTSLLPKNRMPQIGSKQVDYFGVERLHKWIQTLPTPDDLDLEYPIPPVAATVAGLGADRNSITVHRGLLGILTYSHARAVPKVMIIYMPEDEGLASQPILDHDGGDFTKRMIVGPPGAAIVLRNSDEIGHTILCTIRRSPATLGR